jgi:hypothetical protein
MRRRSVVALFLHLLMLVLVAQASSLCSSASSFRVKSHARFFADTKRSFMRRGIRSVFGKGKNLRDEHDKSSSMRGADPQYQAPQQDPKPESWRINERAGCSGEPLDSPGLQRA